MRPKRVGPWVVVALAGVLLATTTPAGSQAAPPTTLPPAPSCTHPTDPTDPFLIPAWNDAGGWTDPSRYETLVTGDVLGDGRTDLLARNGGFVEVNGWAEGVDGEPDPQQWMPGAAGPVLSDASGWDDPRYYETMQLADLDGGGDELVVRGPAGIQAWKASGPNLTESTWTALPSGPVWSDAAGWDTAAQYSTIHAGDVDGNGTDDLIGLAPGGTDVVVASYDASSSSWVSLPTLATGFDFGASPAYYETLQLADVTGDGAAEVVGRTSAGIAAWALAGGTWTELPGFPAGQEWSDLAGWNQPEQYGTVGTADVDGDGAAEVLSLTDTSLETYGYDATAVAWAADVASLAAFPKTTWGGAEYYTTLQYADVTGDGADDLLARGPDGLLTYRVSSGAWQSAAATFATLSDANGWNDPIRYPTIHTTPLTTDGPAAVYARTYMGIQTWVLSGSGPSATWVEADASFPDWAVAPIDTSQPLERAYQFINDTVGQRIWPDDVLPPDPNDPGTHWTPVLDHISDADVVAQIQANLPPVRPRGLNITRDEWDTVHGAVSEWATWAGLANSYLLGGSEGLTSLAGDHLMETSNILQIIESQYFDISGGEEIVAIVATVLAAAVAIGSSVVDPAELPLLAAGLATVSAGLSSWQGFVNPQASITAKYDDLLNQIDNAFCTSVYFLSSAFGQITSDYGLLTTVGRLVGDGTWGWPDCPGAGPRCESFNQAVAAMYASQEIWAFQQFGAVAWRAGHCQPNFLGDWFCDFATSDPGVYEPPLAANVDGPVAWKVVGTFAGSVDCLSHQNDAIEYLTGTLGVELDDIFTPLGSDGQATGSEVGTKGWNLKVDTCTY